MVAAPWWGYTTLSPTSNVMLLLAACGAVRDRSESRPDQGREGGSGDRRKSQDTRGPDAPFPRGRTLTHIPCRHDYASRTMPERRILETTQLLGALPPDTLEALRQQATSRIVSRNEVLFREDDPASELFGIVSGRIAILTRSPDGRESLVAVLDEGSLFGELGLFDGGPRSADARALEESTVLVLGYEAVRAAIDAHPMLLWVIVRLLARRLRSTDESLADAVFLDVPARTAK